MTSPTRLRLIDGQLAMDDGSDPVAYLSEWAAAIGATENTPLAITTSTNLDAVVAQANRWCSCSTPDERFAICA